MLYYSIIVISFVLHLPVLDVWSFIQVSSFKMENIVFPSFIEK